MFIHKRNTFLIAILAVYCNGITPLCNDIYLPSLQSIAHTYHTHHVTWMISIFLFGLAVMQLIFGPISDFFGRKKTQVVSLMLVFTGSILIVFSPYFSILLLGRLLQSIGCCGLLINGFAIIRDSFQQEARVKVLGIYLGLLSFMPAAAPMIGSIVANYGVWQLDFMIIASLSLFFLLIITTNFQESMLQTNTQALNLKPLFVTYKNLLSNSQYLRYCLISCLSYSALFTFLACSPYLLIGFLKCTALEYGYIMIIVATAFLIIGFNIATIIKVIPQKTLLAIAGLFMMLGSVLLYTWNHFSQPSLVSVILPLYLIYIAIGLLRATASALALDCTNSKNAGSASALFGFISFIGASLAANLGPFAGSHPIHLALIVFAFGMSILVLALSLLCRRSQP